MADFRELMEKRRSVRDIKDPALCEEIGLPEDHRIVATIIIGYPGSIPSRPPRNKPKILRIIE